MKKFIFALLLLSVFVFAEQVPNSKIYSADKSELNLYDMMSKSQVTVVSLFTKSCPWCRKELKDYTQLIPKFKAKNVTFVPIYFDNNPAVLQEIAKRENVTFPLYMGGQEIAQHFNVRGVPFTLIIDNKRQVVQKIPGYIPMDLMETNIQALLK